MSQFGVIEPRRLELDAVDAALAARAPLMPVAGSAMRALVFSLRKIAARSWSPVQHVPLRADLVVLVLLRIEVLR